MTPAKLFFCLLLAHLTVLARCLCPTLFTELNYRCYFFSESIPLTKNFEDARSFCAQFNSGYSTFDLLVIDGDLQEAALIKEEMENSGYSRAMIGAKDLGLSETQWVWINGLPLSLESPIWDCYYPSPESANVGLLVFKNEYLSSGFVRRLRLQDTPANCSRFFICEGDQVPHSYNNKIVPLRLE